MNKFNIGDKVVITGGSISGSPLNKGKKGIVVNFYEHAKTKIYQYKVLVGTNYSTYQAESLKLRKSNVKRKELSKRVEELETILSLVEQTATIVRNKSYDHSKYEEGIEDACDLILTIIKKE